MKRLMQRPSGLGRVPRALAATPAKRKLTPLLAAVPVGIALIAAGCGGLAGGSPNGSGGYGSPAAPTGKTATGGTARVSVASSPLGQILVDGRGRTLYLFEKDTGTTSACEGSCASIWPPLTTTGKPLAGQGALDGELGTTPRADGALEVTYNGHPLYAYAGDTKPGDTTGQGLDQFGAEWYVLSPTGDKLEDDGGS